MGRGLKSGRLWFLLPILAGLAALMGLGGGWRRLVESQIFFPDPVLVTSPGREGLAYEEVWAETADRVRIHGWLIPAPNPLGLILFCHGNAGNISHRMDNLRRLNQAGFAVFIFDYRGYGKSQGRISEKGFYLDAEAAFNLALGQAQRLGTRLVVFGRSLGGAAGVYLAAEHPPAREALAGLILESTFTNLADMAALHFPLPLAGRAVKGRLDTLSRIARIKAPLLVIHGDRDDLVPLELGRRLFQAAPEPKEFVTLAGAGHNDTYLVAGQAYFDKLRAFVSSLPLAAPPSGAAHAPGPAPR